MMFFIICMAAGYIFIGLIFSPLYIKEVTGKDTWPNLWKYKKLAILPILKWPILTFK